MQYPKFSSFAILAAALPAHAVSLPGNVADHTLQGVPSMVVRPGSWRETTDALVRTTADGLVSTGLAAKGWNIVAVDDDWMVRTDCTDWDAARTPVPNCSGGRDASGHPIASPSKLCGRTLGSSSSSQALKVVSSGTLCCCRRRYR